MPLRDFMCLDCGHVQEHLCMSDYDEPEMCPHCDTARFEVLPSAPGGYSIRGNNSASTTPRGAGSKKRN